jgi:hypothetical protein
MGIKRIERIDNEFIGQVRTLLMNAFPDFLGFEVEYFIGEDNGTKGLYIEIKSKVFGTVYKRKKNLKDRAFLMDIEENFISEVINDLVVFGITFLNGDAVRRKKEMEMQEAINNKKFKRVVPSRIIHLN